MGNPESRSVPSPMTAIMNPWASPFSFFPAGRADRDETLGDSRQEALNFGKDGFVDQTSRTVP